MSSRPILHAAVCVLALIAILGDREALADRLDLIQKRGTLVVGVKSDYPPFGMLDANGRLIGFEPDLAAELARRLDVRLQLVAVSSTNRLQKLEEGAIDVVIATLGDTPQRRRIATIVEPNYYASGVTVVAPPATGCLVGPICAAKRCAPLKARTSIDRWLSAFCLICKSSTARATPNWPCATDDVSPGYTMTPASRVS